MAATAWRELLASLREDCSSGATALTRRAAEQLTSLVGGTARPFDQELRAALRALATVRPPFGSLFRVADCAAWALASFGDQDAARDCLKSVGERILDELDEEHRALVKLAAGQTAGRRVLTISASSVVRDVLLAGRPPLVTCLESRPGGEGLVLARELAAAGLALRVAPDAAAARLVAESDLVLVGGDTLCPRGLIHKLGTHGLLLAARERGVPTCALLGTLKFLPGPVRGWDDEGSEADRSAVEPGITRWTRLFDLTPLALLSSIVTERGALVGAAAVEDVAAERVHPWLADLLLTTD